MKQIKNLTILQLKNLYGLNVFRYTKDKKAKQRTIGLGFVWALLILMIMTYVGGMVFGYVYLGMGEVVPAYLVMLSSLIILLFSVFKAGAIIFQQNAYDILCSLPVSQTAIVVSRFIRMYVENLLITLMLMIPGIVVYGVLLKPAISFYLLGAVVTVFVPLIPITISTFLGALITAITCRMKYKSLVSAALMILMVVGMMGLTSMASTYEEVTIEMLKNLSDIMTQAIESIYPPAIWLGSAMVSGDLLPCILCILGGFAVFAITMALVSSNFHGICRMLNSTTAKHDYEMKSLQKASVLGALLKREWKRYFSSSIYISNTIVGPVMAVVLSVSILVVGTDVMQQALGLPIDIDGLVPFVLAGTFSMMTTTCTSISLEGKEWWIVKSLPIRAKDLLDSKLLLGLALSLPFYLVSEVLLVIALKPDAMELVWLVLIPLVMIVFANVFGLTINLKMPVFDWENEVVIVKQSASAALGGLGGFALILVSAVPVFLVPAAYTDWLKAAICIAFAGVTYLLYHKNNQVNLQSL